MPGQLMGLLATPSFGGCWLFPRCRIRDKLTGSEFTQRRKLEKCLSTIQPLRPLLFSERGASLKLSVILSQEVHYLLDVRVVDFFFFSH